MLQKSGARMLFTVTGFLDTDYVADAARRAAEDLPRRSSGSWSCAATRRRARRRWATTSPPATPVPAADADARIGAVTSDDLSDIIFTSGTTGKPKGAMITHGQSLRVYEVWTEVIGLREGDRYLIINPFFHTFGYKAGWMSCILRGATIVPHRGVRRPRGARARRGGADHGAAGAARRCCRASSTSPTATSSTCRRCA